MAYAHLASLLILCSAIVSCLGDFRELPTLSFDEGYTQLFGDDNLMVVKDGKSVHLSLDERTGSGFASQDLYLHGFFSASIKLPVDYTAGVVVAFYVPQPSFTSSAPINKNLVLGSSTTKGKAQSQVEPPARKKYYLQKVGSHPRLFSSKTQLAEVVRRQGDVKEKNMPKSNNMKVVKLVI